MYSNPLEPDSYVLNIFISSFLVHDGERGSSWTCQPAEHCSPPVCPFTYNASCLQVRKPVLSNYYNKNTNQWKGKINKKGIELWDLDRRKLKRSTGDILDS